MTGLEPRGDPGPWWKRLGWLVAIWAASVVVVVSVAGLLRWWLVG